MDKVDLKLYALDREGLSVISAHAQDACVRREDMTYLPGQRRFVLGALRYDWIGAKHGIDERVGTVHIVGERDVLRHVSSHGQRLTPSQIDRVLPRAIAYFPQVGADRPVTPLLPEPVVPAEPELSEDALLSRQEVEEALLAGILAKPVEEWMSFLHPAQAKLVRRAFNGPARIRGAAGTGKTVVFCPRRADSSKVAWVVRAAVMIRQRGIKWKFRMHLHNGTRKKEESEGPSPRGK